MVLQQIRIVEKHEHFFKCSLLIFFSEISIMVLNTAQKIKRKRRGFILGL